MFATASSNLIIDPSHQLAGRTNSESRAIWPIPSLGPTVRFLNPCIDYQMIYKAARPYCNSEHTLHNKAYTVLIH